MLVAGGGENHVDIRIGAARIAIARAKADEGTIALAAIDDMVPVAHALGPGRHVARVQDRFAVILDQQQAIAKADYDLKSMDIMPVADPKMVTDMQRAARANVLMQISGSPLGAMQNPQEALKRVYDSVGMFGILILFLFGGRLVAALMLPPMIFFHNLLLEIK